VLPSPIDDQLAYSGNDLGSSYSPTLTHFRVWAPTASALQVVLLRGAEELHTMTADEHGTWVAVVHADLHRVPYLYRACVDGVWRDAIDPYGRASTINSGASVVVDPRRTDPEHWNIERPAFSGESVDAVFYELHTREWRLGFGASGVR
jgi:pullulanase